MPSPFPRPCPTPWSAVPSIWQGPAAPRRRGRSRCRAWSAPRGIPPPRAPPAAGALGDVDPRTDPLEVTLGQPEPRELVAGRGGGLVQRHRLPRLGGRADALSETVAQAPLRLRVAGVGGALHPLERRDIVLWHTEAR